MLVIVNGWFVGVRNLGCLFFFISKGESSAKFSSLLHEILTLITRNWRCTEIGVTDIT